MAQSILGSNLGSPVSSTLQPHNNKTPLEQSGPEVNIGDKKNRKMISVNKVQRQIVPTAAKSLLIKHTRNFSAITMDDDNKRAYDYNIKQVANKLNIATQSKERQQYKAYLTNVKTLNQMKRAFKELYPVIEHDE